MKDEPVVIVMGVRTPFSPFGGVMRDVPSMDLGAAVIKELISQTGLPREKIDEVFYGAPARSLPNTGSDETNRTVGSPEPDEISGGADIKQIRHR